MRVHFLHQHVVDTVIIMEESNLPHLSFPQCNMLVSWKDLNVQHVTTAQCDKGAERKRQHLAEEEMAESAERAFQSCSRPLVTVTSFKYLGRVLTAADDDLPEVLGDLRKVRKSWSRMDMILRQEGVIPRVLGVFFKAVVKEVLLFGSNTWVLTPRMGRSLGSFHHRVSRWITGRQQKQQEHEV